MPFEIIPKEMPKQTIDREIANQLLDIWQCASLTESLINNIITNPDLPKEYFDELGTVMWVNNHNNKINLETMINTYVDKKGIREVISQERDFP